MEATCALTSFTHLYFDFWCLFCEMKLFFYLWGFFCPWFILGWMIADKSSIIDQLLPDSDHCMFSRTKRQSFLRCTLSNTPLPVFWLGRPVVGELLSPQLQTPDSNTQLVVFFLPNNSSSSSSAGGAAIAGVATSFHLFFFFSKLFFNGCSRVKVQSALIRASLVSSAHSGQHRALREHRKCVRPAGLPVPGPGALLLHQRVLAEAGTDTMTVESIYESFLTLLMAGIESGLFEKPFEGGK